MEANAHASQTRKSESEAWVDKDAQRLRNTVDCLRNLVCIVFRVQSQVKICGGLAQLVERLPCKQEVSGSTPLISTTYGSLAQSVRALA